MSNDLCLFRRWLINCRAWLSCDWAGRKARDSLGFSFVLSYWLHDFTFLRAGELTADTAFRLFAVNVCLLILDPVGPMIQWEVT